MLAVLFALVAGWPARLPAAGAASAGCAVSRGSAPDAEESALLARINAYRVQSGLGALVQSAALTAAAAWKANDLGANGYFSHDDLGRSWTQRFADCGYAGTPNISENLAAGNPDAESTFQQWRESSGHSANMLNPSMKAIGVARAYTAGSPFGWYWTATFGSLLDGAAAPQNGASAAPQSPVSITSAPPSPAVSAPPPQATAALAIGATAIVTGTGDCLRVHSAPQIAADETGCLPDGSAMVIAAGPVTAEGYTWWRLGDLGWAVDQYLRPGP